MMCHLCVRMASSCNPCTDLPLAPFAWTASQPRQKGKPLVFQMRPCNHWHQSYLRKLTGLPQIASVFCMVSGAKMLDGRRLVGLLLAGAHVTPLYNLPFADGQSRRQPRSMHQSFRNNFSSKIATFFGHQHPLMTWCKLSPDGQRLCVSLHILSLYLFGYFSRKCGTGGLEILALRSR